MGGVDKRLADLLGLLLPLLSQHRAGSGLCMFPPSVSFSSSLYSSLLSFSLDSMSTALSPLSPSTHLLLPTFILFCPPLYSLYPRAFLLYMEAVAPLRKDRDRPDMNEVKPKKSLKVIKNLFQNNCKRYWVLIGHGNIV